MSNEESKEMSDIIDIATNMQDVANALIEASNRIIISAEKLNKTKTEKNIDDGLIDVWANEAREIFYTGLAEFGAEKNKIKSYWKLDPVSQRVWQEMVKLIVFRSRQQIGNEIAEKLIS